MLINPNSTITRVRRVSLTERVLQVITAIVVLQEKSMARFETRDVASEIDPRMQSRTVLSSFNALTGTGVLSMVTPERQRHRQFEVADMDRLLEFRTILQRRPDDRTRQALEAQLSSSAYSTQAATDDDEENGAQVEHIAELEAIKSASTLAVLLQPVRWWQFRRRWEVWLARRRLRREQWAHQLSILLRIEDKLDRLLQLWED